MLPFLVVHNMVAWWQLTSANYVEHYGLLRERLPDGRYERPQPHHSWNTNHLVSNLATFHLQRHSDHHAHPLRRYQSLRHFEHAAATAERLLRHVPARLRAVAVVSRDGPAPACAAARAAVIWRA